MSIKTFLLKYRRPFIVLVHLLLILGAYILAFLLRFEFKIGREYISAMIKTMPILVTVKLFVFAYFGLFSGLWRYASIEDIWKIVKAVSLSTFIFIVGVSIIHNTVGYPRSIFILDWVLSMGLVTGIRFLNRLFREKFKPAPTQRKRRTLIVGAGEAGVITLRECRNNPGMNSEVVGFIDDDPAKKHLHIQGVKVLGNRSSIPDIVTRYQVEEIIIALPSVRGELMRDIISYCQMPDVKIKVVPGLHRILTGELEIKPREVKPDDLLGRQVVQIDENEIRSYIEGRCVLITGAGGSIGSGLCRQIVKFRPAQLILYDHNENDVYFLEVEFKTRYPQLEFKTIIGDIKDIGLLKHAFSRYRPQIIFHAAAHKHVPLMEKNPVAAVKNNIIGSRNFIYAADHYGVERFVLISTDKAVNPINIMGASKRITEMIIQAKAKKSKTKFMAVRFGNVIGSSGSVVPLFKKQIEEGGPLTITHPEAKRYFMSIEEAAQLVLQAGAIGRGGEIFILDMGEQIKIVDIARNLVTLSGLKMGKDILVEFIGLREGEKLFEEILLDAEKDKATRHNKIYITQPDNFDPIELRRQLKELERLANTMDEERVIRKMKEIISFDYPGQSAAPSD